MNKKFFWGIAVVAIVANLFSQHGTMTTKSANDKPIGPYSSIEITL